MSAPTLDRHPGSSQAGSSEGRRRGRKQLILVASALTVLALAVGTSLALATRPVARQDPAAVTPAAAAEDQNAVAGEGSAAGQGQDATDTAGQTGSGNQTSGTEAAAPVLPDGDTTAYITKVDAANDRIVVDVVQVFKDDQAVKAAIADGKKPAEAKYLTGWVRNENLRLRTLPLAGNLDVRLRGECDGSGKDRAAVLNQLAEHAKRKGAWYFDLTVDGGKVTKIQEQLAANAC
jgi:hypothetical protein